MSGLENLRTRLDYLGGSSGESRFQRDKERSLKKSLFASYQAETAILADGREFKCLINSDKTKADYDCKIISIPYRDICLGRVDEDGNEIPQNPDDKTTQRIETIGMKCGDVFKWKETDTYWLVFLEMLEEDAYFRAQIYKCEEEITVNDINYHIYIRGPLETSIQWNQKEGLAWNDLNYSLVIYITKDENTEKFFHRFKQIKIGGRNWEVQAYNDYTADNIIEVFLDEYYENELNDYYEEKEQQKEDALKQHQPQNENEPYIRGDQVVYPYSTHEYSICNMSGGEWSVDKPNKVKINPVSGNHITVDFVTGKSGNITLSYTAYYNTVSLPIEIKSI
jgi:hypothetical protein